MSSNKLIFLAIIPPNPAFNKIQEMRLTFSEQYHTVHALKSPPHITIISPFHCTAENIAVLCEHVENWISKAHSFSITLNGFGQFRENVIYINVEENSLLNIFQESLKSLLEQINILSNKGAYPFRPHITLAFKDLNENHFKAAWKRYKDKSFDLSFNIESIAILVHEQNKWEIHKTFSISE